MLDIAYCARCYEILFETDFESTIIYELICEKYHEVGNSWVMENLDDEDIEIKKLNEKFSVLEKTGFIITTEANQSSYFVKPHFVIKEGFCVFSKCGGEHAYKCM